MQPIIKPLASNRSCFINYRCFQSDIPALAITPYLWLAINFFQLNHAPFITSRYSFIEQFNATRVNSRKRTRARWLKLSLTDLFFLHSSGLCVCVLSCKITFTLRDAKPLVIDNHAFIVKKSGCNNVQDVSLCVHKHVQSVSKLSSWMNF